MAHRWIVTTLGKDRPGIVAGVTKILYGLGCNLEDASMTRLGGEFAIMLIFSSRSRLTEGALRRAFSPLERGLSLVIHLKRLTKSESRAPRAPRHPYLVSVYGADRPGIVYGISSALARRRVNITDVHAHRSAGGGPPLYLILLEIELPSASALPAVERDLKRTAKRLGVEVSLRASEAAVL